MIRHRVIANLRTLAISLGSIVDGCEWHLFGSVDRDEEDAADIDLMIFCENDAQADALRLAIDLDALELPIHLSLMTFKEAAKIKACNMQSSCIIFP